MAKQDQVLIIKPANELKFTGPFTSMITSHLQLRNPTDMSVCFKIKTTAPKKYCVRPNSGVLKPKEATEIAVILQPFDYDPNEKNKHKFMVQTLIAPEGEFNYETVWKDADADSLMDTKLKCVFEMPTQSEPATSSVVSNSNLEDFKRVDGVASAMSGATDGELMKAAKEVKHLREEESTLRQENIMLKEEVLQLQKEVKNLHHTASLLRRNDKEQMGGGIASSMHHSASPFSTQSIIVAVVMAAIGVLLGKYLL